MSADELTQNGWKAITVDAGKIFKDRPYINKPGYIDVKSIDFPSNDPIVAKTQQHAKDKLLKQTYSHSMRVYYWSTVILRQQFPERADTLSPLTLTLACLLHDIGTTDKNMTSTRLSFEFQGGIQALQLLRDFGSTKDQAEALATIYDNVGEHPSVKDFGTIVHEKTREEVNVTFPREGWLGCFAETIRKEEKLKPWCHTTHIPNFVERVKSSQLRKPYE
ncbi:hypothetical protein NW762_011481 [Fusarium torreyae]|uniref:HD domain-containing protein n=1 Tax=Fusarium torreyae TaxID=1237075 RepID=A0A9W8RTD3_9HYPO|nr:hypothetical protein NW762_011481 [Fusarium torreyae]